MTSEEKKEARRVSTRNWMRRWRESHREEDRLRSFNYRLKNPEKGREWHRNNSERGKVSKLKCNYKLPIEEYREMLKKQGGLCAICKENLTKPQVDHCHLTGQVRGILCPKCNRGLGQFDDLISKLRSATEYLEKFQ